MAGKVTIQQIENAMADAAFRRRYLELTGEANSPQAKQLQMQFDRLAVLFERAIHSARGFTLAPSFRELFAALGYPGSGAGEPDDPDGVEIVGERK